MKSFVVFLTALGALLATRAWPCRAAPPSDYCAIIPAPDPSASKIQVLASSRDGNCSLKTLVDAIQAHGDLGRNEFETTPNYKERVNKIMNAEVMPGIKISAPFGIVVHFITSSVTYDADRQGFRSNGSLPSFDEVSAFLDQTDDNDLTYNISDFETQYPHYLQLRREFKGSYFDSESAETAMGVKFDVSIEKGELWVVHLTPEAEPSGHTLTAPLLHVAPADAPTVKSELAVVFAGSVVFPPVMSYKIHSEITLSKPFDKQFEIHRLNFHPTTAAIIRLDTGEVLARATYDKHGRGIFPEVGSRHFGKKNAG